MNPGRLLAAPFPGVFIRRSVAYRVLLHLMRDLLLAFMAGMASQPVDPLRHHATAR